ncbi:MAG: hypothetical protein HYY17_04790 [Planctomycetes bacterium]|nr:hypothetical protein [Planctomycetota bacterium]
MRTDFDGNPHEPNEGQEKLTMPYGTDVLWKVTIPAKRAKEGYLLFAGTSGSVVSGTGGLDVTFTSIKPGPTEITLEIATSSGTTTSKLTVTSFILRPEYAPQPKKVDCVLEHTGGPGEDEAQFKSFAKTKAKHTKPCWPVYAFEDCARACDVTGNNLSSGTLRLTDVNFSMGSRFRIVSEPQDPCLTGRTVAAKFRAEECYSRSQVTVSYKAPAGSGAFALWKWEGTHSASANILPPQISTVQLLVQAPASPTTDEIKSKTSPELLAILEGIEQPVDATFKIADGEFSFYKVSRALRVSVYGNGSWSTGDIEYASKFEAPFTVRIEPKPLF